MRNTKIDFIKGVCIISVIILHFCSFSMELGCSDNTLLLWINIFCQTYSMPMMFCLSGVLAAKKNRSFKDNLIRNGGGYMFRLYCSMN